MDRVAQLTPREGAGSLPALLLDQGQLPPTVYARRALPMSEVSTFRLYLLRAMYVFMVVGLAIFKMAPAILHPENSLPRIAWL